MSKLIYGIHEPCPSDVMPDGWIVHLVEVGHSNEPHPGIDFRQWSNYGNILRIQHAWGDGGTLPLPADIDGYLQRVASLVQNSTGCNRWIIANEPNLEVEWPSGFKLWPSYVANIYDLCREEIHALPGHADDEVLLCPVGPWNVQIGMDWISYFRQLIMACFDVDGFALHTYSRGPDPASITAEQKMDAPYSQYYNGFRTYRDWLDVIKSTGYNDRPVYITETNQNQPWANTNSGWVKAAYEEINSWNKSGGQVIRTLCLYRWPRYDDYYLEGKSGAIEDFQQAQAFGYTWDEEPTPPVKRTLEVCATLMVDGQESGTFVGTLTEL